MKAKTVEDVLGLGSTDTIRKERLKKFMEDVTTRVSTGIERMERLKKRNANMYRVLLARLTDDKTDKLLENPVIYAIRVIKKRREARSFFLGYSKDIRRNLKKHPARAAENPKEYARAAIMLALNAHFTNPETRKLWTKAVNGEKTRYSWVLSRVVAG